MQQYDQQYILDMLRQDRERGAELLLEAYAPLLWSVCQRRLSDPEDIKECVNDVFAEFCIDPGQYDPSQASLKNYLAMLADRKAISCYRRSRRHSPEPLPVREPQPEQEQLHWELEEALSSLTPEDARIIRLKYYGGLTYREIARQMGITEDAAKKRGTRSLKKLAKWMIIGLMIAALLAGCAYVVHRYFRYAKGIGLVENQETAVYQMVQPLEPQVGNGVSVEIMNVSWAEGRISVAAAFLAAEEGLQEAARRQVASLYELYVNGVPVGMATDSNPVRFFEGALPEEVLKARETVTLELILNEDHAGRITYLWREVVPSTLTWELQVAEVEALESLTDLGRCLETEIADFLIMTDREIAEQNDAVFALVSLYPLYKEENWILSDLVTYSYQKPEGYEPEPVSLVAQDGTVYPVSRVTKANGNRADAEYILWFQDAPAGSYTLRFPRLCYKVSGGTRSLTLPLPQQDGRKLTCREEVTFQDGTVLRYTGVTRETTHRKESFMVRSLTDGQESWEFLADDATVWEYRLEFTVDTGEDFPFFTALGDLQFFRGGETGPEKIPRGDQVFDGFNSLSQVTLTARDALQLEAPETLSIHFGDFFCMDEQEYTISVTIQ